MWNPFLSNYGEWSYTEPIVHNDLLKIAFCSADKCHLELTFTGNETYILNLTERVLVGLEPVMSMCLEVDLAMTKKEVTLAYNARLRLLKSARDARYGGNSEGVINLAMVSQAKDNAIRGLNQVLAEQVKAFLGTLGDDDIVPDSGLDASDYRDFTHMTMNN